MLLGSLNYVVIARWLRLSEIMEVIAARAAGGK